MALMADGTAPATMSTTHNDAITLLTTSSLRRSLVLDITITGMLVTRTATQMTKEMKPLTTITAAMQNASVVYSHTSIETSHSQALSGLAFWSVAADCGSEVRSFGQRAAANWAALPTANAGSTPLRIVNCCCSGFPISGGI